MRGHTLSAAWSFVLPSLFLDPQPMQLLQMVVQVQRPANGLAKLFYKYFAFGYCVVGALQEVGWHCASPFCYRRERK